MLTIIPTDPFTSLELRNPSIDVFLQRKVRRLTDFEATKLWKGGSGKGTFCPDETLSMDFDTLKNPVGHSKLECMRSNESESGPRAYPTGHFTTFELWDQEINEFYVVRKRLSMDYEVRKLWKGSSRNVYIT